MKMPRIVLVMVIATACVACGGARNNSTADGGAVDGAPNGADAASPDADQDSSLPDTGDAGAVSCSTYCGEIMDACTGGNAQYANGAACMNACAYFPPRHAGVTSGDTIACRATHADLARAAPNPHCWSAGPFGYGECGATYEGFCDIATALCSVNGGFDAGPPPFNSQGDCWLRAAMYPLVDMPTNVVSPPGMVGLDGGYSANGPTSGNTFDCRGYYLGQALQGGAAQQLHCNHVGAISATCM
jgi:hypothetical protein